MKGSSIDRIVGRKSDEPKSDKRAGLETTKNRFQNQEFPELKGLEREKTPEEAELCLFVNSITNKIRASFGLTPFDIPPENIHVIKNERWAESAGHEDSSTVHRQDLQGIVTRDSGALLPFARRVLHDMLHMQLYNAMQYPMSAGNETLASYRIGLSAFSRDGTQRFFKGLNEAITEGLTIRAEKELFEHPLLKEAVRQTNIIRTKNPNMRSFKNDALSDENVYWAEIRGRKATAIDRGPFLEGADGTKYVGDMITSHRGYKNEREILNMLVEKILKKNGERFKTPGSVFDMFASAAATGKMLALQKLIDASLGKGTFVRIAELDSGNSREELRKFVSSL